MKKLKYNDSSQTVRFEMPHDWLIESITGVNIQITNNSNEDILAATAATLYTSTTTNAAVAVGDGTVTLAGGASAVVPGDRLRIAASVAGPAEDIEVESYNSSTKVITLARDARYAHTTGTAVYGMFVTYALDTSDTDDFPLGLQCSVLWIPDTDDLTVRERYEVIAYKSYSEIQKTFAALYPREYTIVESDWEYFEEEARAEIRLATEAQGLIFDRIVEHELTNTVLRAGIRWLAVVGGGDKWVSERTQARKDFDRQLGYLMKFPAWQDTDMDNVKDDNEIDSHTGWGHDRGI